MANKFISGTLILTLSGFVVKAIGSINWIILSRILGGEGIGIYQMAFPIYLLALDIPVPACRSQFPSSQLKK